MCLLFMWDKCAWGCIHCRHMCECNPYIVGVHDVAYNSPAEIHWLKLLSIGENFITANTILTTWTILNKTGSLLFHTSSYYCFFIPPRLCLVSPIPLCLWSKDAEATLFSQSITVLHLMLCVMKLMQLKRILFEVLERSPGISTFLSTAKHYLFPYPIAKMQS